MMKSNQSKGLDTCFSEAMYDGAASKEEGIQRHIDEGVLLVSSPVLLDTDFVFVKGDAGKGLFGGQKAVFHYYIGSIGLNEFQPGATFKMWGLLVTGINNIYRNQGFL
jgi:hypothetical protein